MLARCEKNQMEILGKKYFLCINKSFDRQDVMRDGVRPHPFPMGTEVLHRARGSLARRKKRKPAPELDTKGKNNAPQTEMLSPLKDRE